MADLTRRHAALRLAAWNAFDEVWREVCGNFGDFEAEYRAARSARRAGAVDDLDCDERAAAFELYGALLADTLACHGEDELRRLDEHAPPKLGHIALQWFREGRESRGGAS